MPRVQVPTTRLLSQRVHRNPRTAGHPVESVGSTIVSLPAGWSYIHVVAKAVLLTKIGVDLKWDGEEYRNDPKGCRKALEDIVRVLGDDGNDQTSEGLNSDRSPRSPTKIHQQIPASFGGRRRRWGSTQAQGVTKVGRSKGWPESIEERLESDACKPGCGPRGI